MDAVEAFWRLQRQEQFLIVGFSELTGLATALLLERMAVPFKISDCKSLVQLHPTLERLNLRRSDVFCGPQESSQLEGITQILLSPGVPRSIPLIREAQARAIPVWNDYDFLYPVYENKLIAAVTGTDGKTTTTTLLGHLLRPSRTVTVAGNIGVPIAAVYDELLRSDVVVLELSSFMLEDVKRFRSNVSSVLNIAQDHVERYASMNEYAETKRNILRFSRPSDVFVKNLDDECIAAWELPELNVRTVSSRSSNADAQILQGSVEVLGARLPLHEFNLQGEHLIEDALVAAVMAAELGVPASEGLSLARQFAGVPHRFEYVGRFDTVDVIDDSKATSVQSAHRALESLRDRSVVLILGGQDKHLDPTLLARHEPQLRAVVGYGQAGQRLIRAFSGVPTHYAEAFADSVRLACNIVEDNDVLLLSPICTSFDQHRDYRERGQVFRSLVRDYFASIQV